MQWDNFDEVTPDFTWDINFNGTKPVITSSICNGFRASIPIKDKRIYRKQDTCSNKHEVCPMPLHKYEAQ